MIRPATPASLVVVVALTTAVLDALSAQAPNVDAILAATRAALGGEKRLAAVKSFVATGRTRQVRGDNLVPIEFEISCELPDKYIRRDEIPAQESGPTTIGFNGATLIQLPPPPAPPARAGGPPGPNPAQLEAARANRVAVVKQDFARLTLGMFAASFSAYPLTFTYVGEAEAPQGKADVIDVSGQANRPPATAPPRPDAVGSPPGAAPAPPRPDATTPAFAGGGRGVEPGRGPGGPPEPARGRGAVPGPANFTVRLFVYKDTHLPIMVSWQAPLQGKPVEQRLYYADYRDVDGLKLPFRLRRSAGGETTEETVFDRYRINPTIDPRKFEVK